VCSLASVYALGNLFGLLQCFLINLRNFLTNLGNQLLYWSILNNIRFYGISRIPEPITNISEQVHDRDDALQDV